MACVPNPIPPIPVPPASLTLTVPIPPVPQLPNEPPFCCKLPAIPAFPLPPLLPPLVVNPAFMLAIHNAMDAVEQWRDSLPLDCPRS